MASLYICSTCQNYLGQHFALLQAILQLQFHLGGGNKHLRETHLISPVSACQYYVTFTLLLT